MKQSSHPDQTMPADAMQTDRPPSIWSGQFVLALTIGMAFAVAFNGLVPVLPLYLNALGMDAREIGLVVGAYLVAALVLRPLSGRLTDQFGPLTVTLAGCLLFAVSTPFIAFTANLPLLIFLRVVQSAGLVCFFTASTTLNVATVDPRRTGRAVGVMGLTYGMAGVIASPFAVQVTEFLGWAATLTLLAGLAGLAALLCVGVRLPKRAPSPVAAGNRLPLVNRRALAPAAVFLAFTMTQGPILAFVPLLAAERELGNPGFFLAAVGAGNILVRGFIGSVADTHGRHVIIIPGLLLAGVAMLIIPLAPNPLWFAATGVVYGMANGMAFTGLMTLTLDRVPFEERGSAIATFQWSWDIGSSVSAAVLGMLVAAVGYGGIFLIAAGFPFVGAAAFVWAMQSRGFGRPV